MLYMTGNDDKTKIIVLEAGNIERLLAGGSAATPDSEILVTYTPDPVWLADQILAVRDGDLDRILDLIAESKKRKQKPADRPYHKPFTRFLAND